MICQTLFSRCLCIVREKQTKKNLSLQLHQVRRNLLQCQNRSNPLNPLHQLADHRLSSCPLQQSHKHITYSCKIPRSHPSQSYSRLLQAQCQHFGAINKHRYMCRTKCTPRSRQQLKRNASYPYKWNSRLLKRRHQHQVLHLHRTTVLDRNTIPFSRHLQLVIQVLIVALQHQPRCTATQITSSIRAITTSTTRLHHLSIPCINSITSTINSNRHQCSNSNNISK